MKKQRTDSHAIERRAINNIRKIIDAGEIGLFRELTGGDYGVDAIVEVFDCGRVTGKIALIQCKGTSDAIKPMKKDETVVSCSKISSATVAYAGQNNTIVLILYANSEDDSLFYYINLFDALTEEHKTKINNGQKSITVRIPVQNNSRDNMDGFWNMINNFYAVRNFVRQEG